MSTATLAASVTEKTIELCQSILDDPGFAASQEKIEAFLADGEARAAYAAWQAKGQELHSLSHQGLALSPEDLAEFDRLQAAVDGNPVASDFMAAEDEMNTLFASVTKRVQKTFQLGRLPADTDLEDSGCCGGGGGCGCSH
jgi:cell fate (sporulation/competence/biofilm development) regulator YlbF (YheA/YmcA/DUF963 family)